MLSRNSVEAVALMHLVEGAGACGRETGPWEDMGSRDA